LKTNGRYISKVQDVLILGRMMSFERDTVSREGLIESFLVMIHNCSYKYVFLYFRVFSRTSNGQSNQNPNWSVALRGQAA